jgi:hypothetical protein
MAFNTTFNSSKKEYSIRSSSSANDLIPETVLDSSDPAYQMQQSNNTMQTDIGYTSNPMYEQANEKIQYQASNNIQAGTPEWFRLWFAKPNITGESPFQ